MKTQLSCSRRMIEICLKTIAVLNRRERHINDLAKHVGCSVTHLHRALRALRASGVPIETVRVAEKHEWSWKLTRQLDEGEAAAVVACLYLPDKAARALRARARVGKG